MDIPCLIRSINSHSNGKLIRTALPTHSTNSKGKDCPVIGGLPRIKGNYRIKLQQNFPVNRFLYPEHSLPSATYKQRHTTCIQGGVLKKIYDRFINYSLGCQSPNDGAIFITLVSRKLSLFRYLPRVSLFKLCGNYKKR